MFSFHALCKRDEVDVTIVVRGGSRAKNAWVGLSIAGPGLGSGLALEDDRGNPPLAWTSLLLVTEINYPRKTD